MDLAFDISEDELPIFLAECNDQLEALDEGLLRLERDGVETELIQTLFRAAHTLKGSAGMIGHKRMVEVTHVMETAFDRVRKGQIQFDTALIDICLETVDALHLLCDEVATLKTSAVDILPLTQAFSEYGNPSTSSPASSETTKNPPAPPQNGSNPDEALTVQATISQDSIASAARAFQIVMALQEMGTILSMQPTQEQIDQANPVQEFTAQFAPSKPVNPETIAEIKKSLSQIGDIESFFVGKPGESQTTEPGPETGEPAKADPKEMQIGKALLESGLITQAQLDAALAEQARSKGPTLLVGQALVKMGFITQEVLDQVLADQNRPTPAERRAVEPSSSEDHGRGRAGAKMVRTSVERLDNLMNLVGELITDRNRLYMIRGTLEEHSRGDGQSDALAETITHIGRITDQLQAEVMGIRMLPVSNVFNKFPRMVRDLSRRANKQVDLVIRGEDTELDRSVIEEISDPLLHLLRNAVDHGLETPEERLAAGKLERGTILLTARYEQGRIFITVEDDGRGIDLETVKTKAVDKGLLSDKEASALSDDEAIDLIFASGLSTAKIVSDVSGRGVGMDIVRNNVERLSGSILVETWPGSGTQFQMVLPLTLAILPTLLVRVNNATFAIPLVMVTETMRISANDVQTINSRPVIVLRDHVLPVIRLSDVFEFSANGDARRNQYVVVVRSGKTQLGLIVDTLVGEQEVVVKSLGAMIGDVVGISSAAILGDGQVALIVDVQGLFKLASQFQRSVRKEEVYA